MALQMGPRRFPHAEREQVWGLLAVLADDPDPTPEHEERYGGDNGGPRNAVDQHDARRGDARRRPRYALWTERALTQSGRFAGMASLPEVEGLLERHLDLAVDGSLAIRSVYGQWFPQFVRIDKEFAQRLTPRVFPKAPELGAHFDAAWNAYIVFNRAFTDVFEVLRNAYALAVERLGEGSGRTSLVGDPRERLGDHLLTYRILGATSGGGEDLFATFWRAAPPDRQAAGPDRRGLVPREDPRARGRGSRAPRRDVWEWIYDEASGGETAPLAGFGAWLGTAALNGAWVLAQARAVLELDVHLEPDFVVYRALPRLAREHPREVVEVLRRMVLTDAEGQVAARPRPTKAARLCASRWGPTTPRRGGRAEALVHLARGERHDRVSRFGIRARAESFRPR